MSQPRTKNGRFIPRDQIPGVNGCEPPPEPFEVCGVVWVPEDARKDAGASIGLALAMEWQAAGKGDQPDEAGAA